MIELDHLPSLDDPALVVVLTGWVDAGYAGATAAAAIADALTDAVDFARVDLADAADLQATRPMVRLADGGIRTITWPEITMTAGRANRDVVLVRGPEPSLRWPEISTAIVDVAGRVGVTDAFALGGMPALASHRRPIRVLATASSRSLAQELGPLRDDYAGPTGFQTVLQHALGEHGIRAAGLWAEVPQYVAASASPPATRALLHRLEELAGIHVDLSSYDDETQEWVAKIDEGLEDRPDVAALVEQLEERLDEAVPSGDELVSEIERFLRAQGDD